MLSASFLTVLAHELRSPATVIAGYMRMLREGRLDEPQQHQAFAQVEAAAHRIALISQQASSMRQWMDVSGAGPADTRSVNDVLDRAIARAGAVPAALAPESDAAMRFPCRDRDACVNAFASLLDAVVRDAGGAAVTVRASLIDDVPTVVMGSSTDVAAFFGSHDPGIARAPFSPDRGGHGLALALASVILYAHGAKLWIAPSRPTLIGITLPSIQQGQP